MTKREIKLLKLLTILGNDATLDHFVLGIGVVLKENLVSERFVRGND